ILRRAVVVVLHKVLGVDFFKALEVSVIQIVEKRSPRYGLVLVLQFARGCTARYQEEAQYNTKDHYSGTSHMVASPKRLLASLQQSLVLHCCPSFQLQQWQSGFCFRKSQNTVAHFAHSHVNELS